MIEQDESFKQFINRADNREKNRQESREQFKQRSKKMRESVLKKIKTDN